MAKTARQANVTGEVLKRTVTRTKTGERVPLVKGGVVQRRKDGTVRTKAVVVTRTETTLIGAVRSGQWSGGSPCRDSLRSDTGRITDHGALRYARQAESGLVSAYAARIETWGERSASDVIPEPVKPVAKRAAKRARRNTQTA